MPLFLDQMAQLSLHRFESVVNHLRQWLMCAIVGLFLFRYQFVSGRNRHVDTDPKGVTFFMGVIRLFNGDIAPADMIAEFIQPGCLLADHLFDALRFGQTAITDIYRQLHK